MATPYLTPDQFRAGVGSALADTGKYPDAVIEDAVAEFEELAEQYRGCAFTPRERVWSPPNRHLEEHWRWDRSCGPERRYVLPDPFVSEVTAATNDEVDLTDLSTIFLDPDTGILQLPRGGVWAITYTYGLAEPPRLIVAACRDYVKAVLLRASSNTSRDAFATSSDGVTYRYVTPDATHPTGYIDVDRRLNSMVDLREPGIA